ncbi:MAG: hypothetical protein HWD83_10335 [Gammaproteobacteria bacterium]|nr:hypothetical protein [Gammaproteobacteria bacterium]
MKQNGYRQTGVPRLAGVIAIVLLSSCSSEATYQGFQQSNLNDCETRPLSQYDECVEAASQSFEEYQREREEALEPTQPPPPCE